MKSRFRRGSGDGCKACRNFATILPQFLFETTKNHDESQSVIYRGFELKTGGAVRGESVQILQHLLCGLIRTQIFSKEGAENDSVLEYEDGKRGNKLNMPHSGYSTKTSPFQEETPLCGSILPGKRGRRAGGVFHVLGTMAKVPMPPFSSRGGMISGIRRGA